VVVITEEETLAVVEAIVAETAVEIEEDTSIYSL
jgi:hypothetical protein